MSQTGSDRKPTPAAAKAMLQALELRVKAGGKIKRVNNAALYAGSSMYYYCRICGHQFVLDEGHKEMAPSHCAPCIELLSWGYSFTVGMFPSVDVGLVVKPLVYMAPPDKVVTTPGRPRRVPSARAKQVKSRRPSRNAN